MLHNKNNNHIHDRLEFMTPVEVSSCEKCSSALYAAVLIYSNQVARVMYIKSPHVKPFSSKSHNNTTMTIYDISRL